MTIDDLIDSFPTTPFIFAGSGLTRRYYNLPNLAGLLEIFAKRVSNDELSFAQYMGKANKDLPRVASLISQDFDEKWYADKTMRTISDEVMEQVADSIVSPFKAEIAAELKRHADVVPEYKDEIALLKEISSDHITGFITTNYDCFLETLTGYRSYVGQDELIFSSIQGVGEIYKIHGSIDRPSSIIIDERDYADFNQKCAYLAAKLMTIFMEYPIIFIGYSLSDRNIQNILSAMVECIPTDKYDTLKSRFVFIDYNADYDSYSISDLAIPFPSGKILSMTKITLSDFSILYNALKRKKSALPVRLLRLFKEEFYNYVLTNTPSSNMRIAGIDDNRVSDEELVLAICKPSMLSLHGLKGIKMDDWYQDILLNNLQFTADEMLTLSYPEVIRQSTKLPIYKYLSLAKNEYPNIKRINCFDDLLSNTIKKNRYRHMDCNRNVHEIIETYSPNFSKVMDLIAYLNEEDIDLQELEGFLLDFMKQQPDIFKTPENSPLKTNFRRLIRIYDWLKYGRK